LSLNKVKMNILLYVDLMGLIILKLRSKCFGGIY